VSFFCLYLVDFNVIDLNLFASSRKPFVPPNHWLLCPSLKEQQLSSTDSPASSQQSRHTEPHSQRQLTYLSPRLGVLDNIPFAIPFNIRVCNFVFNDTMLLYKEVFDMGHRLWLANVKHELYLNPHAYATQGRFSIFLLITLLMRDLQDIA